MRDSPYLNSYSSNLVSLYQAGGYTEYWNNTFTFCVQHPLSIQTPFPHWEIKMDWPRRVYKYEGFSAIVTPAVHLPAHHSECVDLDTKCA